MTDEERRRLNPWDPEMRLDYTGTDYTVVRVRAGWSVSHG